MALRIWMQAPLLGTDRIVMFPLHLRIRANSIFRNISLLYVCGRFGQWQKLYPHFIFSNFADLIYSHASKCSMCLLRAIIRVCDCIRERHLSMKFPVKVFPSIQLVLYTQRHVYFINFISNAILKYVLLYCVPWFSSEFTFANQLRCRINNC